MEKTYEEVKFSLPALIRKEIRIITETGYYENEEEFILEAIGTLLMARKDLRVEVACRMFQEGEVSMGKAMEISGLDIDRIKKALRERGIKRISDESPEDIRAAAEELLQRAGGPTS